MAMDVLTHNQLRVSRRNIELARLPEAFNGLRIIQISDLHFYEYSCPDFYSAVVHQINAISPDLILLTGDVVHYGPDYINSARLFLSQLQATMGKWAILGNHDYNDSQFGELVGGMLPQAGFQLLKNESDCLQRDGQRLWLAGLEDLWYGAPDISKALSHIPTERDVTLIMAHNPLLFDPIALGAHGQVDLVLAGHTHAGHVYIPFLGPIYRKIFRMKYRYGLYEKNGCQLHVTSGVGSAAFYLKKRKIGFPRFRFNTWPEIAVLTLSNR